jgi:kinesin family protein 5
MQGSDIYDNEKKGIIPRINTSLFEYIERSPEYIEFRIKISMIEIYMEKIHDLLNP